MANNFRVHKYTLQAGVQGLEMHEDAEVLSVGAQGHHLVVWVREDTFNKKQYRNIYAIPTGGAVKQSDAFHGTVQFHNGIVVHVFEGV